jgi:hypothetical protein
MSILTGVIFFLIFLIDAQFTQSLFSMTLNLMVANGRAPTVNIYCCQKVIFAFLGLCTLCSCIEIPLIIFSDSEFNKILIRVFEFCQVLPLFAFCFMSIFSFYQLRKLKIPFDIRIPASANITQLLLAMSCSFFYYFSRGM